MSKAESWIVEESEVDPEGRVVRCCTKNLDHVKVMRVEESITLRQTDDGFVLISSHSYLYLIMHTIKVKLSSAPKPGSSQVLGGV